MRLYNERATTLARVAALLAVGLGLLNSGMARADGLAPPGDGDVGCQVELTHWGFSDTNWLTDVGHGPVAATNIVNVHIPDGNGNSMQIDSTDPAFLQYRTVELDGTTNLTVDRGSITVWLQTNWTSTNQGGTGPGQWGRLLEV